MNIAGALHTAVSGIKGAIGQAIQQQTPRPTQAPRPAGAQFAGQQASGSVQAPAPAPNFLSQAVHTAGQVGALPWQGTYHMIFPEGRGPGGHQVIGHDNGLPTIRLAPNNLHAVPDSYAPAMDQSQPNAYPGAAPPINYVHVDHPENDAGYISPVHEALASAFGYGGYGRNRAY